MAFLRRVFTRKSRVNSKPSANGDAMSAKVEDQLEGVTQQTAALSLEDDGAYNPDTVPYEVATFALS